jgi:hypothetical protein
MLRARMARIMALVVITGLGGMSAVSAQAVEQGTVSVTKTWAGDQEPAETVQVCFAVSSDSAGTDILGTACTADTYTVVFGPTEPPLATGVTYYVWEILADTGEILKGPFEAVIPATSGNVDLAIENPAPVGQGAIEVHVSGCPNDYDPYALFDTCHANGIEGDELILDGPVFLTGNTSGPIGAVRWDGLPEGTYTIAEAVMTGDYAAYEVYCSTEDGTRDIPVEYRGNGRAAVMIDLPPNTGVVCDWYNVPATSVLPMPTPAPTQANAPTPTPSTGVVSLPDTGSGPSGPGHFTAGLLAGTSMIMLMASAVAANRPIMRQRDR